MNSKPQSSEPTGCFGRILALFGIKPKEVQTEDLPYRLRDDFLSSAEHSFYLVLRSMMGEFFAICPKVNLRDIFFVAKPGENSGAYNRINRKHVDFLICEPKTMKPKFAIELDDGSHKRSDREERDQFVDSVFSQARLPLVRVRVSAAYNKTDLGELFRAAVSQSDKKTIYDESKIEGPISDNVTPNCPKCGIPMVMREAKRGPRQGERFYGCDNYPSCKEIVSF